MAMCSEGFYLEASVGVVKTVFTIDTGAIRTIISAIASSPVF